MDDPAAFVFADEQGAPTQNVSSMPMDVGVCSGNGLVLDSMLGFHPIEIIHLDQSTSRTSVGETEVFNGGDIATNANLPCENENNRFTGSDIRRGTLDDGGSDNGDGHDYDMPAIFLGRAESVPTISFSGAMPLDTDIAIASATAMASAAAHIHSRKDNRYRRRENGKNIYLTASPQMSITLRDVGDTQLESAESNKRCAETSFDYDELKDASSSIPVIPDIVAAMAGLYPAMLEIGNYDGIVLHMKPEDLMLSRTDSMVTHVVDDLFPSPDLMSLVKQFPLVTEMPQDGSIKPQSMSLLPVLHKINANTTVRRKLMNGVKTARMPTVGTNATTKAKALQTPGVGKKIANNKTRKPRASRPTQPRKPQPGLIGAVVKPPGSKPRSSKPPSSKPPTPLSLYLGPDVASIAAATALKAGTNGDMLTDEQLLKLLPKKVRKKAKFDSPVASRFCHVCSRTPKNVRLAVCANIRDGVCRKVVCERCFDEYAYGVFDDAYVYGSDWTCPHCQGKCPARAQCRTYGRINDRLRVTRLKQPRRAGTIGVGVVGTMVGATIAAAPATRSRRTTGKARVSAKAASAVGVIEKPRGSAIESRVCLRSGSGSGGDIFDLSLGNSNLPVMQHMPGDIDELAMPHLGGMDDESGLAEVGGAMCFENFFEDAPDGVLDEAMLAAHGSEPLLV
jgi:hypothetical protein